MTHPKVLVSIDGVPVSGLFTDRLVSLTVTDREGIRSDTLEMIFNDDAPHFSNPRRGAVATVAILDGEGLSVFSASYVIDRVEFVCAPYTISVRGHSADLRSEMKTSRSRHWDNKSVKDIVTDISNVYDLESKISDAVSGHVYSWIGQQDESDLSFLERLAKRHGALFTIKNGTLLWLERGAGKTADGTSIPTAVISRTSLVAGSCRMSENDVDRFGKVKATFQDRAGGKRQEVVVEGDPDADGEHVIRDPFSSKAEAKSAAEAFVKEMRRGSIRSSCSVVGGVSLVAGQPYSYIDVRPHVDGRVFIAETVKRVFSKGGGLRATFDGKLKAGA